MKNNTINYSKIKPNFNNFQINKIYIFLILIILIAIFFRFVNLDTKVYWIDETATSLRVSGYSFSEWIERASLGQIFTLEDLYKYQYPNQEKNFIDTIRGLATEEPQLPPLYYFLSRCWVEFFGYSVASIRSLSAFASLLVLPSVFWLCRELFNSQLTGVIAVVLIAISPFHVLYAQEARPYSLWTLTIVLSSAALLRAIRVNSNMSWMIYSITLILGLYTYIFSGLVAIGHSIYVFTNENLKINRTVKNYFLSTLVGSIFFLPWIIAIIFNLEYAKKTTDWTSSSIAFTALLKVWLLNLDRLFIDYNYNFMSRNILMYMLTFILLSGVIYSFYFLVRHTPKQSWLFLLTLIGITSIVLVSADLFLGGKRSGIPRYVIPCYLGIEITLAYTLAVKIMFFKSLTRQLAKVVVGVLIFLGIFSCNISYQAETWWNKYNSIFYPEISKIVDEYSKPIVITSTPDMISLKYSLSPHVDLLPLNSSANNNYSFNNLPSIIETKNINLKDYSDIFVYNSSKILQLLELSKQYSIDKTYEMKREIDPVSKQKVKLWKINNG